MKKHVLLLITFCCFNQKLFSQPHWEQVGDGLPSDIEAVNCMATYNGELYAGCRPEPYQQGNDVIAKWNGSTWSVVAEAPHPSNSSLNKASVNTLCVYNGELYAGGLFDSIGGVAATSIAKWDGNAWHSVVTLSYPYSRMVTAMCVHDGRLFIAGYFDSVNGQGISSMACFDGSTWQALIGSSIFIGTLNGIFSMCSHQGVLYIGGSFSTAQGAPSPHIMKWDGLNFSAVSNFHGRVYVLISNGTSLYAGGGLGIINPDSTIIIDVAEFNGTDWSPLGITDPYIIGEVYALAYVNGELYAGLNFQPGNPVITRVAKWDGTNWIDLDSLMIAWSSPGIVNSLCEYGNELYVGGLFNKAGSAYTRAIAKIEIETGIPVIDDGLIQIFPSLSHTKIKIKNIVSRTNQFQLTFINTLGQQYERGTIKSSDLSSINISDLPQGMYEMVLQSEQMKWVGKLIKL